MIWPGCGPASGFAAADIPDVAEPAEPDDVPAPTVLLPDAPRPEPRPVPPEAVVPEAPPVPLAPLPLMLDPALLPPMLDPPAVPPGCIAGDPDVVEPEPVAVGRSEDGAEVPCAKADAVRRAVAIRHAVIWVLSI